MTPSGDGGIDFADDVRAPESEAPAWKILIADDNRSVHEVLRLALGALTVAGRWLEFRDAYDGEQACRHVYEDAEIALVLMDLTMGGERGGIEAAQAIRGQIGNRRIRIVLCTGDLEPALRPGTVEQLDLSACWQKTDLTARRLRTIVESALERYAASSAPTSGPVRVKTGTFRRLPTLQLS